MTIRLIRQISNDQQDWRNNPEIMKYCRQNEILGVMNQSAWTRKIEDDPSIEMFGISIPSQRTKEEPYNHIVGTCGLTSISYIHRTAEYSILIGPEFQRKGYATKAMIALLDYGFKNLDLECIWGEVFTNNPVGLKLAKELGFKEEGTLRSRYNKEGKRIDTVMVSMLKKEWQKNTVI